MTETAEGSAQGGAIPPPDWLALADEARHQGGVIDRVEFGLRLQDYAAEAYCGRFPQAELVEFPHGSATYLFDCCGSPQSERTVLAVAQPQRPTDLRDVSYQRGYPIPETVGGRAVDRGHFIPYTASGLFGPNLFVQDRALNRGWSEDGRAYRALEDLATKGAPGSLMFVRPIYTDDTDNPGFLDLGVVIGAGLRVRRFRNRFDNLAGHPDLLAISLAAATNAQIGALGEETAGVLLEDSMDATIVTMGDAGLPRDEGRQDLDLVAIVDGNLIVFEVKTRYVAKLAGRLTRAGHLLRPRLRRPRGDRDQQASQAYVSARLAGVVDTENDYAGVEVRVLAVDFKLMLAQQFAVDDGGSRLTPVGPPLDCTEAAERALAQIIEHRGYL